MDYPNSQFRQNPRKGLVTQPIRNFPQATFPTLSQRFLAKTVPGSLTPANARVSPGFGRVNLPLKSSRKKIAGMTFLRSF